MLMDTPLASHVKSGLYHNLAGCAYERLPLTENTTLYCCVVLT